MGSGELRVWGSLGYLRVGDSLDYYLQSSSSYIQPLLASQSPCPVQIVVVARKDWIVYSFLHNHLNSYFRQQKTELHDYQVRLREQRTNTVHYKHRNIHTTLLATAIHTNVNPARTTTKSPAYISPPSPFPPKPSPLPRRPILRTP